MTSYDLLAEIAEIDDLDVLQSSVMKLPYLRQQVVTVGSNVMLNGADGQVIAQCSDPQTAEVFERMMDFPAAFDRLKLLLNAFVGQTESERCNLQSQIDQLLEVISDFTTSVASVTADNVR